MGFYSNSIVERVRERRVEGLSLRELAKEFQIPNATISRWVRDVPSSNSMVQSVIRRQELQRNQCRGLIAQLKDHHIDHKIPLALLYWCEGAKYPATNGIQFTNSDTQLVRTFLQLLRQAFPIDEKRLKAVLQIHETQNYPELLAFWSQFLELPVNQFYQPTITARGNKRKRRNYMGTCTINYYDVQLLLQISGIYEEFAEVYGEVAEWPKAAHC